MRERRNPPALVALLSVAGLNLPALPSYAQEAGKPPREQHVVSTPKLPASDFLPSDDISIGGSATLQDGEGGSGWKGRFQYDVPVKALQNTELPSLSAPSALGSRVRIQGGNVDGKPVGEVLLTGYVDSNGNGVGGTASIAAWTGTRMAHRFPVLKGGIFFHRNDGRKLEINLLPLVPFEDRLNTFTYKDITDGIQFTAYGSDMRLYLSRPTSPIQLEIYGELLHLLEGYDSVYLTQEDLNEEGQSRVAINYTDGRGIYASGGAEIAIRLHKNLSGFVDGRIEYMTHKGEWRTTPITAIDPAMEIQKVEHRRGTLDIGVSYHFGQDAR